MPKRKTHYLVWRDEPGGMGQSDVYGIIGWDIEAWNAAHAARLVRNDPAQRISEGTTLGVCPSIYFSQHK